MAKVQTPACGPIPIRCRSALNGITCRYVHGKLAGAIGHWNSPIVVDGHIIEPEGNANDHQQSGTMDVFSVG